MGRRKRAKNAIAPHEQEGSRPPAAGQPPEQTSVGSGAEGPCQAPDVLARARGWFKPGRLKLAAVSNSAVDSLVSYKPLDLDSGEAFGVRTTWGWVQ